MLPRSPVRRVAVTVSHQPRRSRMSHQSRLSHHPISKCATRAHSAAQPVRHVTVTPVTTITLFATVTPAVTPVAAVIPVATVTCDTTCQCPRGGRTCAPLPDLQAMGFNCEFRAVSGLLERSLQIDSRRAKASSVICWKGNAVPPSIRQRGAASLRCR